MAEFGARATELSGPSQAGAAPLQPVQGAVSTFDTSWLNGAAKALTGFLSKPEVDPMAKASNYYVREQTKLAQLRDLEEITPKEFEKRRRILFNQTVSTYGPELGEAAVYESVSKIYNAGKAASGTDDDQNQSNNLKKAQDEMFNEAVKMGMADPAWANDPGKYQQAIQIMQKYKVNEMQIKNQRESADEMRKQAAEKRQGVLDDRETIKYERAEFARQTGLNAATTLGDTTQLLINDAVAKIAANPDSHQATLAETMMRFGQLKNLTMASLADNPEMQSSFRGMATEMETLIRESVDPNKTSQFGASEINLKVQAAQLALGKNQPDIYEAAAITTYLGSSASGTAWFNIIGADIVTSLANGQKGKPSEVIRSGKVDAQKQMNEASNRVFAQATAGKDVTPNELKGATISVNSQLKELGEVQGYDRQPLSEALKLMAGPSVAAMIKNGSLDKDAFAAAHAGPYRELVRRDLYNRAQSSFNTAIAQGTTADAQIPLSTVLKMEVDEAGNMKAVPNFNSATFNNVAGAERQAYYTLSKLNKNMGDFGAILRIEAHRMGRTDYAKVLEEHGGEFFPSMFLTKEREEAARAKGFKFVGVDTTDKRSYVPINDGAKNGTNSTNKQ